MPVRKPVLVRTDLIASMAPSIILSIALKAPEETSPPLRTSHILTFVQRI